MNSIKRMTSSMSERRCTFPATFRDLLPLLFFTLSPYCNQFTLFLSLWKVLKIGFGVATFPILLPDDQRVNLAK